MSDTPSNGEPVGGLWTGDRAERWVRLAAGLEVQLAPVADLLVGTACPNPGERVLDVGCGTGPTTRMLAASAGPDGSVVGLDVSADMIAAADSSTASDPASAPISWVEADATDWRGIGQPFDLVFSRFGVMFFDDPHAAFANLASLTSPEGRLCVAVWAERHRSPLFEVPLAGAVAALDLAGAVYEDPGRYQGPFSLGDPHFLHDLLETAGWTDVSIEARTVPMVVGGGQSPLEAARGALDFGPTRLVTTGIDDALKARVVTEIASRLEEHVDSAGRVVLEGTPMIVSARPA